MVRQIKEIGEQHYREEYGRLYEDFEIGDIYDHRPGRTVTQMDNIMFTLLTMNTHPLHFNAEYGKTTEFGECLVNSALTVAIITGMTVSDVSYKAIANLGWSEISLSVPVFHGDTLFAESEVLDKRVSDSRTGEGIVTVRTKGRKQTDEEVLEFNRSILVPMREGEP